MKMIQLVDGIYLQPETEAIPIPWESSHGCLIGVDGSSQVNFQLILGGWWTVYPEDLKMINWSAVAQKATDLMKALEYGEYNLVIFKTEVIGEAGYPATYSGEYHKCMVRSYTPRPIK